jgi:nucleotide-binding universal stress UspA family protein
MAGADILVILRAGDRPRARLELAARIARREGVRVQGVCVEHEPATGIADCWAIGSAAVCDVLERRHALETEAMAPLNADFHTVLDTPGLRGQLAVASPWETREVCFARPASCGLVLLRQPDEHDAEQRHLVETMAARGGAPCLITQDETRNGPVFHSVVVGWDGGAHVRRAIKAALPLLEPGSRIELFTVGPLGNQATDDTRHLIERLRSRGFDAQSSRTSTALSSIGYALLRRCDVVRADLLVMGAFSKPPGVEAVLGGATKTALLRAQIPLLLAH